MEFGSGGDIDGWLVRWAVPFLLGAVATWLAGLWARKTTRLTYHAHLERFAASGTDAVFGNVDVHWQGRAVPNLYLATVTVTNPTLRDLDDVHLHVTASVGLTLLTERSQVLDSPNIARYDKEFLSEVIPPAGTEPTTHQLGLYNTSRQYRLPVLNRGQSVQLSYLCTNDPASTTPPMIFVSGVRKGTKFVRSNGNIGPLGVSVATSSTIGLIATILAYVATASQGFSPWVVGATCAVMGMFAQLIGASIFKLFLKARGVVAD